MQRVDYPPVTPGKVYAGLFETEEADVKRAEDIIRSNIPSGNSYMDLFADLVRCHGRQSAHFYAAMFGVEPRRFDGAIHCMSGMGAHDWISEYLNLAACDLLAKTSLPLTKISKILHFSPSSFSQFFQSCQKMQPYQYRSIEQNGWNRGYHLRRTK